MSTPFTVLGASGFVGRHLTAHLRGQGYDCRGYGREPRSQYARPLGHVIYAIGLTSDFRQRPLETVEAHVCVLRELLAEGGFESLTYLSSTRVYAGASATTEDTRLGVNPNDPSDLYNLSKLTGEALCLHAGAGRAKVVRLSNVVGLRDTPDSFIDQLLEEGWPEGRLELQTALDSRKDYIYIDDAVAQITAIAQSPATGIYNVAGGAGIENREITELLTRQFGWSITVRDQAPSWRFPDIDTRNTAALTGLAARPFAEYFPTFLNQYRQHRGS